MVLVSAAAGAAPETDLVSELNDTQAEGGNEVTTGAGCIAGNGNVVGFFSSATNLVPAGGDLNEVGDLFVRDGATTTRVNVGSEGEEANAEVFLFAQASGFVLSAKACSLSDNGQLIAFATTASNLKTPDNNNSVDVFVRDLTDDSMIRIGTAVNNGGDTTNPTLSGNGNFVAFRSAAGDLDSDCNDNLTHVFRADISDSSNVQIKCVDVVDGTAGNGAAAWPPGISSDGRYIAFDSAATNLVGAADTNGKRDIFLFDNSDDSIIRVSEPAPGQSATESNGVSDRPIISANGAFVAFVSAASNLVSGDTNAFGSQASGTAIDVFVYDRVNSRLLNTRANVDSDGQQAVALREAFGGIIAPGLDPSISSDGRYITFVSNSRLTPDDTDDARDIYFRDRVDQTTTLVSINDAGTASGNGISVRPAISADGDAVVFDSQADDLIANDGNDGFDVFIRQSLLSAGGTLFNDQFEEAQ